MSISILPCQLDPVHIDTSVLFPTNNEQPSSATNSSVKDRESRLLKNYDFNFTPLANIPNEHFALMEMLELIESYIHLKNDCFQKQIRERVKLILLISNHSEKMGELGLIVFYLTQEDFVPIGTSLLLFHANQMKQTLQYYESLPKNPYIDPLIPTGKTHYILDMFTRMIAPDNQVLNIGGVFAIRELLQNFTLELSLFLQPEHRNHILNITHQILKHPGIQLLFKQKITISSSLKEMVRLDLKLSSTTPLDSTHAHRCCLQALLVDIRQITANCYAVGDLINLIDNHPYYVLSTMLKMLQQGYYDFNHSNRIPLNPLLENRVTDLAFRELSLFTCPNHFYRLPLFQHLMTLFNFDSIPHSQVPISLETLFIELFKNLPPSHLQYAHKLLASYKRNIFIELHLLILEFANNNFTPRIIPSQNSIMKHAIISNCVESIVKCVAPHQITPSIAILATLGRKLSECLWLESRNYHTLRYTGTLLEQNRRSIHPSPNELPGLIKTFRTAIRLFHMSQSNYTLIDKISDLQNWLIQLIREIPSRAPWHRDSCIRAIKSKNFKYRLSLFLSQKLKLYGYHVSCKELYQKDLLILGQWGGGCIISQRLYPISSIQNQFYPFTSYQLLEKLFALFKGQDQQRLKSIPNLLIVNTKHVWTLDPTLVCDLFNHPNFQQFANSQIFTPAKQRLASRIPNETMWRIIDRLIPKKTDKEMMYIDMCRLNPTYKSFKNRLCSSSLHVDSRMLEQIIESEFSSICFTTQLLQAILDRLSIKLDKNTLVSLYRSLPERPGVPYQAAKYLRKALIQLKIAIVEEYEIEKAICAVFRLPLSIFLGDTNHIESEDETSRHEFFVVKFSWFREGLSYYYRTQEQELWKPNFSFYSIQIHFPISTQQNINI